MIRDENSSDLENSKSDFQSEDSEPQHVLTRRTLLNSEEGQNEAGPSSAEATTPYNFRLSRCKYANLIDQSDIEWWMRIQAQRLSAGEADETADTTATATEANDKATANSNQTTLTKLLNYEPITCPITDCKLCFLPNDLLLHYLSYHKSGPLPVVRVRDSQRVMITLSPFDLNIDEVRCLGLIAYAMKHVASGIASELDLWLPQNIKLCPHFIPLSHDYPIFLLASIVPMDVFMRPRNDNMDSDEQNICGSMLVLWLAGLECSVKIAYTLTAFSDELTYSRSGIYEVRTLTETQNPYEFCIKDCNYFRLTLKELYSMLRNEKYLRIELIFPKVLEDVQE